MRSFHGNPKASDVRAEKKSAFSCEPCRQRKVGRGTHSGVVGATLSSLDRSSALASSHDAAGALRVMVIVCIDCTQHDVLHPRSTC